MLPVCCETQTVAVTYRDQWKSTLLPCMLGIPASHFVCLLFPRRSRPTKHCRGYKMRGRTDTYLLDFTHRDRMI